MKKCTACVAFKKLVSDKVKKLRDARAKQKKTIKK